MKQFKKYTRHHSILLCLLGAFLLLALTLNYQKAVPYMFGDEMVYYMMAQSLAFDGDLEYTQEDLERVYRDGWSAGPLGVFLSKIGQKIYYSKYFIYSLVLAPFMAVFGLNGFLVLNVSILFLMILMGWIYLRQYNSPDLALSFSLLFFLLAAGVVYVFWLTPEVFNMGCVTTGLFLWLYAKDHRRVVPDSSRRTFGARLAAGLRWLLLSPEGRLYLAPIPIAMAAISKLPNILFFAPIAVDVILFGSYGEKPARPQGVRHMLPRNKTILIVTLIFLSIIGSFYALQYFYIGQFNPYAGDRKTFYHQYPLSSAQDLWEKGIRLSNDDYMESAFYFHPKVLLYNLYYYVFGRFTGILPYFCCSLLALYLFFRTLLSRKKLSGTTGKRVLGKFSRETIRRVLLALTIGGSMLAYIIMAPSNYQGGGGAFGNRFFLNIYPAFLFLVTLIPGVRPLLVSGGVGLAFLAQALINPFAVSFSPATHAFHGVFRLLPVELTLIDTLPTLVNRHLMQTAFDAERNLAHRLYFFDENIYGMSAESFWVKGGKTAEMAVQTFQKQEHLVLSIANGPVQNVVKVSQGDFSETFTLAPGETQTLVRPLKEYLPHFNSSLHPLNIRSQNGFIPSFHPESASRETSFLGCQVSLSFAPLDVGIAYVETRQPEKAIEVLEPLLVREPGNIQARYALGRAYQQSASFEEALKTFQTAQKDLGAFAENFLAEVSRQDESALPKRRFDSSDVHIEDLQDLLNSMSLQYRAEELLSNTGEVLADSDVSDAESLHFIPDEHVPGFLAYGPYVTLPPGEYLVKFDMKIGESGIRPSEHAGLAVSLDVHQAKGETIAAKQIRLVSDEQQQIGSYQEYVLAFRSEKNLPLEFRVKVSGRVPVSLKGITVTPMFPARVYEALGESFLQLDKEEKAYQYFHQVMEQVGDVAYTPNAFDALIDMRRWEDIAGLVQQHDAFSEMKSGPFSSLLDLKELDDKFSEVLAPILEPVRQYFTPELQQSINFQERLTFHGLDLNPSQLRAGESFRIAYYWEAIQALDRDYIIFVHFLKQGSASALSRKARQLLGKPVLNIFQQDHAPLNGEYPTSRWETGEIIREQFDVPVPEAIEAGKYDIWLGIYDAESGEKMKSEGENRVKVGEIVIHASAD